MTGAANPTRPKTSAAPGPVRHRGIYSDWRLRTYPRVLLIPLVLSFAVAVLSAEGASTLSGHLGGDFPAFYSAGSIVGDGNVGKVYNLGSLTRAQEDLVPSDYETLRFAYPPFVAHTYSFLAKLPYREAYVAHTAFMFLCLAASIAILSRMIPTVARWRLEAFVCAAWFYPLYRAMTGGQNSALTVLLITAVYWALHQDRPVLAGGFAGLLLFKPQLAIPVIGLLLVRNWRSGVGFAVVGGAIWSWSAAVFGAGWLPWWIRNLTGVWGTTPVTGGNADLQDACTDCQRFNDGDAIANASNSVNILGVTDRVLGSGSVASYAIGGLICVIFAAFVVAIWRRPDVQLDLKMAFLALAVVLIPPHVLFYDGGLLVIPMAVLAGRLGRQAMNRLLLIGVLGLAAGFALQIGMSALFPAALLTTWWSIVELRRRPHVSPSASTPVIA